MSDFPVLETDRLLMRELVAADASEIFAIHGDAAGMRWFGGDPLVDLRQAQQLIAVFASWRKLPNPGTRWGIQRKADGRLIGTCGLFKWNRGWRSCTVGYELARAARGDGNMAEALVVALNWGFEHMNLNRVEAQVHPLNEPSLKLVARLGFVQEGLAREAGYWQGEFHDLFQFGLLRRDWKLA